MTRLRGHTLVEVLVAMAIAGGAIVSASALFAQAGEMITSAREATAATMQARALLERFLGQPAADLIAQGTWGGLVPELPEGNAAATFVALGAPGIEDPPVRIAVTVTWSHRGRERRMTLATVRF
jgi:prepilin-type N-terminal cleavage/methylation domain-containing protein